MSNARSKSQNYEAPPRASAQQSTSNHYTDLLVRLRGVYYEAAEIAKQNGDEKREAFMLGHAQAYDSALDHYNSLVRIEDLGR